MAARDEALRLLNMAKRDLEAATAMISLANIADEVFGFHVQQAVEKTLKGWLVIRDLEYPHSHDLALLLQMLERKGEDLSQFWSLADFTPFAVQYRYEAFNLFEEQKLDRRNIVRDIQDLFDHVNALVDSEMGC